MSSNKYQILCQKCTELKNKKAVKFRAKDNGKEKSKDHEPQSDVIKQRKRSKTTWRKLSVVKPSGVRSSSKPGLHHMSTRSKRLGGESPYESACETDDCGCTMQSPAIGDITPKIGILKRRASSADAVACCRNFDVSPFAVTSGRIGNEEEDIGKTETYSVPSLGMFEEKRPKKIRFKIPEGTLGYEDAKKAMWRSEKDGATTKKDMNRFLGIKGVPTKYPTAVRCNSLGSPSESIREIMPVLERLKKDDDLIESELDLNKIAGYIREENEKARKREKLARERRLMEESEESEREFTEEDTEMESDATDDGGRVNISPKRRP